MNANFASHNDTRVPETSLADIHNSVYAQNIGGSRTVCEYKFDRILIWLLPQRLDSDRQNSKRRLSSDVSLSILHRPPSTPYRQKGSETREVRNVIYADVTALHTVLCGAEVYMAFIFSSRGAY